MQRFRVRSLIVLFFSLFINFSILAQDTLRLMSYNLLNYPDPVPAGKEDTLRKILEYHPVDLLFVCELKDSIGAKKILSAALNHSNNDYSMAKFVPAKSGGSLQQLLYFNHDKVVLYSQSEIKTGTRDINEYVLYVKNEGLANGDTTFIDVYVCHFKASSGTENENKRTENATALVNHLKSKPVGRYRIVAGDFNLYSSAETAYQLMVGGTSPLFEDPLNAPGNWHNNFTFSGICTQSTRSTQISGDGSTGGMDDRFDFILLSPEFFSLNSEVNYVNSTYNALGNDGSCFNKEITDCGGAPKSILNSLKYMSDHLPVVADIFIKRPITHLSRPYFKDSMLVWKDDKNQLRIRAKNEIVGYTAHIMDINGRSIFSFKIKEASPIAYSAKLKTGEIYYLYIPELGRGIKFLW
jgi:hypothetical protein